MRPLPTFRQLLLLLALGCVLPMAGLALGLVAYEYQRDRDHVLRGTVSTARALMAAVDDRFDGVERALNGLAMSPALQAGDFARLHDEAMALSRGAQVGHVTLVENDGHQLFSTGIPYGYAPNLTWPDLVGMLRSRRSKVMDLFRSPLTGEYIAGLGLSLPQARALHATMEPEHLREVLLRQKLPSGWVASVMDRNGRVVASTHDHERAVGTAASPILLTRLGEAAEDSVATVSPEGVPLMSAFSRSERTGWSVVIGIPRDELRAPILRSSAVLLAGTGAVLLLTLWLAWRLARALGASIEALGGAVRAAGHHVPLELPEPAFQEAHQLGQALLHSAAAMEDATTAQRRAEAQVHSILDTATDAIVTADAQGRIVLFNRAAEDMFLLSQDIALGREVETLLPLDQRQAHREWRERLTPQFARIAGGGRIILALRGDGSTFRAAASISVSDEGGIRLFTAILRELPPEAD